MVTFVVMCEFGVLFLIPRTQLLFHSVDSHLACLPRAIFLRRYPLHPEFHCLQGSHSYQISGGQL